MNQTKFAPRRYCIAIARMLFALLSVLPRAQAQAHEMTMKPEIEERIVGPHDVCVPQGWNVEGTSVAIMRGK